MTISVVIPTFDRPAFLAESIESAINQTLAPNEIVVVDGHPEATAKPTLASFSQQTIVLKYIHHPIVGNVSRLRNIGVINSQSHFVSFIDDDDKWDPAYLENVSRLLSGEKIEAVFGSIDYWHKDQIRGGRTLKHDVVLSDLFLRNPGVSGSGITISKTLFNRLGGFDEDLAVSEDKDLFMRLLESNNPFSILPDSRILARQHDQDHLMGSTNPRQRIGFQRFYDKYREKMSLTQRRSMKAKIAYSAFRSSDSMRTKIWFGINAVVWGEKAVIGDLLRNIGIR